MPDRLRHVLFLCTNNSARSQMAEGIARSRLPDTVKISSAGSKPTRVQPLAVQSLREIGIDISAQRAKGLDAIDMSSVDLVITLCTDQVCPYFPGRVEQLHWPLEDPARENSLDAYRRTRDQLFERIGRLFQDSEEK